jgi:hypothetical protein
MARRARVTRQPKIFGILVVIPLIADLTPMTSFAITAELAKKCRLMAIQAHPTQLPGKKDTGVVAAQRNYFSDCISHEGKMDTRDSDQKATPRIDSDHNKMPGELSAPQTVPR